MDWKTLLFSPNGRINRSRYWITVIIADVIFSVVYVPFTLTINQGQQGLTPTQIVLLAFVVIFGLVLSYIGIILGIKRYHDRDKSGWWVLIAFVPLIGGIWYLVEVGFLRGTVGRNRFGPDPLAPNDDIVQVFGSPDRTAIR